VSSKTFHIPLADTDNQNQQVGAELMLYTCARRVPVSKLAKTPNILTEVFHAFPRFVQLNDGV
jgi:hypothetical protein